MRPAVRAHPIRGRRGGFSRAAPLNKSVIRSKNNRRIEFSTSSDDEDGEIKGIDAKAVDPLLDVKKELDEMRALVDERGRTLSERADRWTAKMAAPQPVPKTATAKDTNYSTTQQINGTIQQWFKAFTNKSKSNREPTKPAKTNTSATGHRRQF